MKLPESLFKAWAAGLEVETAAHDLEVTGGEELSDGEYDALLHGLSSSKDEVVTYLKESAFADLMDLTRDHGLCWALHDGGRAIFMDYPLPGEGHNHFTPEDRVFIFSLYLRASPLPHERRHDLMRGQEAKLFTAADKAKCIDERYPTV